HFFRNIRRGKRPHHPKANFGERQPAKFLELLGRMPRNFRRHVKPTVRRKSAKYRATQRRQWSFPRSAAVSHCFALIARFPFWLESGSGTPPHPMPHLAKKP